MLGEVGERMTRPRIVLVLVGAGSEHHIRATVDAIRTQIYPYWQLDVSSVRHVSMPEVLDGIDDTRVVHRCLGKPGADGDDRFDEADLVALIRAGDILAEDALLRVATVFEADPRVGVVYGDEDTIDRTGGRRAPFFKPDWDPLWIRTFDYIGTPCFAAARNVRRTDTTIPTWDFSLRACERAESLRIVHIPKVLCHRSESAYMGDSAAKPARRSGSEQSGAHRPAEPDGERVIIEGALRRQSVCGDLLRDGEHWRIHYELPVPRPRVSIVIPTRDSASLLDRCVGSVRARTQYPDFEIVIVDNGSRERAAVRLLDELISSGTARVVAQPGPFNFSALCNAGAAAATGGVLVLLNDDTEVIDGNWLDELAGLAVQPGIGLVGALLLYPDLRIQHAGVIVGLNGIAEHRFRGCRLDEAIASGRISHVQSITAVTAACMAVRHETWNELGGLDQSLAVAGNDIDLCLRAVARGDRNVWTPHAVLIHDESASRGYDNDPARRKRLNYEIDEIAKRWAALLANDPAYNVNLTLKGSPYALSVPPRDSRITMYPTTKSQCHESATAPETSSEASSSECRHT